MTSRQSRDLFGGAISADLPPVVKLSTPNIADLSPAPGVIGVIDVSDIRQVPDSQEVFVYTDSDSFLSIEVLQRVPKDDDLEAVKYHFTALAEDNDATGSTVVNAYVESAGILPHVILEGKQEVRKFNQPCAVEVDIVMALYRVKDYGVDVIVSASIPRNSARLVAIKEDFYALASSFRIHNYGLFGSTIQ